MHLNFMRQLPRANEKWLFVIFCLFIYLSFLLYVDLAGKWTLLSRGINTFNYRLFVLELPTAIVYASFFYFSQIRPVWLRFLLPLITTCISYRLIEVFYHTFMRSPTLSDLENAFSMADFSLSAQMILIGIFLLVFSPLWVILWQSRKQIRQPLAWWKIRSVRQRVSLVALFVLLFVSGGFFQLQKLAFNYIPWSDENNIRQNGRLSTFFYLSFDEIDKRRKMKAIAKQALPKGELFSGEPVRNPNIHIIVLESFIDPRLIPQLGLDKNFVAPNLVRLLQPMDQRSVANQKTAVSWPFEHLLSPIYGGGTAQAEFEVLTGVPALSKFNKIEFNLLTGHPMQGFSQRLKQSGYRMYATIAPSSRFFNSKRAYKSLGFSNVTFLQDEEKYQRYFEKTHIFDGDLFEKNLADLQRWREVEPKRPIFNYVLGMYGHYPFLRDKTRRPDRIKLPGHPEKYERIANQFYYRTDALANYLSALLRRDPSAIIFVVSDHLPAILDREHRYEIDWHSNIALYIDQGRLETPQGLRFYQIPHHIWYSISGGAPQELISEEEATRHYYQLLLQGTAKD